MADAEIAFCESGSGRVSRLRRIRLCHKASLRLVRAAAKPIQPRHRSIERRHHIRNNGRRGGRLVPRPGVKGGSSARSVARRNRVVRAIARTVTWATELVAHAAENRPHVYIDVVIGKSRDSAVRFQRAEVIEISFDTKDPVACEQQLSTEADGPADLGTGC